MTGTAPTDRPGLSLGATVAWTTAVAVLWIVVALLRPETTLHLGPVLVPMVPMVLSRREDHAVAATWIAAGIALAVTVGLSATGTLDGPAITPFPNALVESLAGVAVGTGIGLIGIRSAG